MMDEVSGPDEYSYWAVCKNRPGIMEVTGEKEVKSLLPVFSFSCNAGAFLLYCRQRILERSGETVKKGV